MPKRDFSFFVPELQDVDVDHAFSNETTLHAIQNKRNNKFKTINKFNNTFYHNSLEIIVFISYNSYFREVLKTHNFFNPYFFQFFIKHSWINECYCNHKKNFKMKKGECWIVSSPRRQKTDLDDKRVRARTGTYLAQCVFVHI